MSRKRNHSRKEECVPVDLGKFGCHSSGAQDSLQSVCLSQEKESLGIGETSEIVYPRD
jgi:hypothetical protein